MSVADRETTKRMVYGVVYGIGKDKLSEYWMVKPQEAQDKCKVGNKAVAANFTRAMDIQHLSWDVAYFAV